MRKASTQYNLKVFNSRLAREWDRAKNGILTPMDVRPMSNKKAWWKCHKGHSWESTIGSRSQGHGCPYCSGRFANEDNNLQKVRPHLIKEWHPTKNGNLSPRNIAQSSMKKVWWLCSKGHEWFASPNHRSRGSGCPYCSGQKICKDNCLETVYPVLHEWHPTKNGAMTPRDVTPGSGTRTWWLCKKGHEWESKVNNRTHGYGCPYCSGRLITEENNLAVLYPDLARQWHPHGNGKLTPKDVSPGSEKRVWWICDCKHKWQATVINRTKHGSGCPYCSGRPQPKSITFRQLNLTY